MDKPTVVILSAFLSPHRSGAEAMVEEVAMELNDDYDITIVTTRWSKDLPKEDLLRSTVKVRRVGFGSPNDKWLFPFLGAWTALRMKPHIIHAVLESFAGAALMLLRPFTKAKTILTCQSTNTSLFVKQMHRPPHVITVISRMLQERAASFGRKSAVHISNGLHLKDIPESDKIPGSIVCVGRLREMKGIDVLLQVFQKLLQDHPHATLRLVGEGHLEASLKQQAVDLGIAEQVTFVGYVPTPDVYEEFAQAEIFCCLSRHEAFGNVFAEAQAARCAVVGTNIEGIPDIVTDGENGLLVPKDDVEAALAALMRLFGDPDLRMRLAEAGKQNAQKYDWPSVAKKYGEVYKKILS